MVEKRLYLLNILKYILYEGIKEGRDFIVKFVIIISGITCCGFDSTESKTLPLCLLYKKNINSCCCGIKVLK